MISCPVCERGGGGGWAKGSGFPTLEVPELAGGQAVPQYHAGGVHHNLPLVAQDGADLPRPPALLQPQHEEVVLAMQAEQHPLAPVHALAGEPQGVGTVAQVGTDT